MRFVVALPAALAAVFSCTPCPVLAQLEPDIIHAQPHLETERLTIETGQGERALNVEVARTNAEQQAGLMFRRSVPLHGGMIFPMRPVRVATFWMKNTIIPLDMLFVRTDGTIARITTAKALSTNIDGSGEPVGAVLELGAGNAAKLGIKEGDRVHWKGLSPAQ